MSIYIAVDANTRSRQTANRLTELSEVSLQQLKQQTATLSNQTQYLSQQLDEQRAFSETTATKLDRVIDTLHNEVAHLNVQTSSLAELVTQGRQQNIFAVEPFGWWRRDKSLLRDTAMQAAAKRTIQSNLYAWPAKSSAIAFLSDSGVSIPGLQLRELLIDGAEFHNHDMMYSDFSQTSLIDVVFGPEDSDKDIKLTDSLFRNSRLSNVKFKSARLGGTDFRNMVMRGGQFIRGGLYHTDFSHASLTDVTFDTVQAGAVNFTDSRLTTVLFLCRAHDVACSTDVDVHDLQTIDAVSSSLSHLTKNIDLPFPSHLKALLSPLAMADFRGSYIVNSRFSVTPQISMANFSRASVHLTAFDLQRLYKSAFYKARVLDTSFHNAVLTDMNARDAALFGVSFADAQLDNADFSGALFHDVSFVGARLRNSAMHYDNLKWLDGAQLSGYLVIVIDHEEDMGDALSELSMERTRFCATEDFGGFGINKYDDIKEQYNYDDPETVWARVPKPLKLMKIFMPRKCE